jgi:subtilase family serine protease
MAPSPANTLGLRDTSNGVILTVSHYGFGALQPGESISSSLHILIPGPADQTHTLTAVADDAGVIGESDETDNAQVITFTLDAGDQCDTGPTVGTNLIMDAVSITGSGVNPRCGEPSTVHFTVRNEGTVPAVASKVGFDDSVLDTGQLVGSTLIDIPPLNAGQTYSASATIVIQPPANVVHRLRAFADYTSVVAETDEGGDNARDITFNVDDAGQCE